MQRNRRTRLYLKVQKGKEPVWVIRRSVGFGKTEEHSTGCSEADIEGAECALANFITENYKPNLSERDPAKILIADVLNQYAKDVASKNLGRDSAFSHIRTLGEFWGDKTLDQVDGERCLEYLQRRTWTSATASTLSSVPLRESVRPSTVRREFNSLQAAINNWNRRRALIYVPKVTRPEAGQPRERFLEKSEVARLLRAARKVGYEHVARFILLGIYTGTRRSAILSLRWQVSLSSGSVDLKRGIIFRRGSSERESTKRRPPVSVPWRLQRLLRLWAERDGNGNISHVIHHNGRPIHPVIFNRHWGKVRQAALLGPDVTPHVLKHTCCTWLLWSGMQPWDVGNIVGTSAETIQRVYGHHRLSKEVKRA